MARDQVVDRWSLGPRPCHEEADGPGAMRRPSIGIAEQLDHQCHAKKSKGGKAAFQTDRPALTAQALFTHILDERLQHLDPPDQPGKLLGRDLVMRRIASIDVSAVKPGKAAPGKLAVARPCLNQPRLDPFSMRAKHAEPVRFRGVEREHEE